MTEQVELRRRRHHRRGPAKRFILATGPFILLAAAFLLSAGVVGVIEQAPASQPAPTLAEERAMAETDPPAALQSAAIRPQSLPGELLEGSDYDLEYGVPDGLPTEELVPEGFASAP